MLGLQQHLRSNPKEWKRVTSESPYRNAAILTSRFRDGDYAGVPGRYEADEEKGKKKKSYFISLLLSYLIFFVILGAAALAITTHWESSIQPALRNIVTNY